MFCSYSRSFGRAARSDICLFHTNAELLSFHQNLFTGTIPSEVLKLSNLGECK